MILVKFAIFDHIFGFTRCICGSVEWWKTDKLQTFLEKMNSSVYLDVFYAPSVKGSSNIDEIYELLYTNATRDKIRQIKNHYFLFKVV